MSLFLGIDVGTSGVRTAVIDDAGERISSAKVEMPPPRWTESRSEQDPRIWWTTVCKCLDKQASALSQSGFAMSEVDALAVSGTSGTLLLADERLEPVAPAQMYNSAGFFAEAAEIDRVAPQESIARGAGSTLARLLHLQRKPNARKAAFALHQADWIASNLIGRGGGSDETNALKLGYDLFSSAWPDWLADTGATMPFLPAVHPVGTVMDYVSSKSCRRFGFSPETKVASGTTDSCAAFLGAGAKSVGDGVTSLGTTLAVKLLSDKPVLSAKHGVYSHRLFGMWLAGGASNTGGGVLLELFPKNSFSDLETFVNPSADTGLDYYPLSRTGERFPHSDPEFEPRLSPRPSDEATFFQGVLEGIARVERLAYRTLADLGANAVVNVRTTGGGSKSKVWTAIRRRILNCPVSSSAADAADGSSYIALRSVRGRSFDK